MDILFGRNKSSGIEYIIIGLGNPEKKYEKTRHNAGFMAIDKISDKTLTPIKKVKYQSLTGEVIIDGTKCLLMKPNTYMNLSGEALITAMRFYKIAIEKVIVLYDDISLDPSLIRIRTSGSAGGHNGIKSIIALTGSDSFIRVKLGVGQKPNMNYDLSDWVLSTFKKDEIDKMDIAYEKCYEAVKLILIGKISEAMNKYQS